jgi:hypothetical protein
MLAYRPIRACWTAVISLAIHDCNPEIQGRSRPKLYWRIACSTRSRRSVSEGRNGSDSRPDPAVTAALIARSVMISNHRQAWINGLREDLAAFFAAIDVIHSTMTMPAQRGDASELEQQQKTSSAALIAYRKILMRLNMRESLHQQLEKSLEALLMVQDSTANQDELTAVVTLARTILKREWEVTKYGPFTALISRLKTWRRRRTSAAK